MKVLWFTNTAAGATEHLKITAYGGGWLNALCNQLKNMIELHIAFYHNAEMEPFILDGIWYYPINMKLTKLKIIKNAIFRPVKDNDDLQDYLSIIARVNPDLIHIHGTENPFGCIIYNTKIPTVVSIQGILSSIIEKYFSGIESRYAGYRHKNSIKDYLLKETFWGTYKQFLKVKAIEQRNMIHAKYIIGRTSWDRRVSQILAPESTYYHNDEALNDIYSDNTWVPNFEKGKLKLYSTSRNSIFKGFETICRAQSVLLSLNIDIEWVVGGIGENDAIVSIVKKLMKDEYPKKGLVLLGSVKAKEIVDNMLSADIYVMSSHIENSPNSLCEAMMLGMPCVATYAGGTSSLLQDGHEGILIQDGDGYSMSGAILELYKNQELAICYGNNARERALKRHDKNRIVSDLVKIYSSVIKSN